MYGCLTARVKKPETRVFFYFFVVWGIVGILIFLLYFHHVCYTTTVSEPYLFALLIACIPWTLVFVISIYICFETYTQRAYLENWVYFRIRSEWKFTENHSSTLFLPISLASLLVAIIFGISLIAIGLPIVLAFVFVSVLWIGCDGDISKFGENINNYTSVILVFIFMAQAWIFYQQYCHMKQPFFKAPLLWTLSKSNSDTDCCILLKNGGNAPIFDVLYQVSEVLVKDIWGYKITKSEEISKYFLPRLDGGSEKEILEKPTKEFKEMRLAVYLSAKTLDGHSTRLFFYKAPGDMDFRLAGSVHN